MIQVSTTQGKRRVYLHIWVQFLALFSMCQLLKRKKRIHLHNWEQFLLFI